MTLLAAAAESTTGPGSGFPVIGGYSDAMPGPGQVFADYRVGADREHPTMLSAQNAAKEDARSGLWSRIIVDPGVYVEQWSPENTHKQVVVAATPGTVEFVMPEGGGFSTINTWGGQYYVGGITFTLPEGFAGSGAYALHHHSGRLSIFEQCTFRSFSTQRPSPAGADTDSNTSSYWIRCVFDGPVDQPINFHGAGSGAFPSRHVFVDCVAPAGLGYSASADVADELWIVGDDTDIAHWRAEGSAVLAYVRPGIPAAPGVSVTPVPTETVALPRHGAWAPTGSLVM